MDMKRRKAKDDRKEASIRIRLTEEQKRVLEDAAASVGLDLSGWLRFVALREAGQGHQPESRS